MIWLPYQSHFECVNTLDVARLFRCYESARKVIGILVKEEAGGIVVDHKLVNMWRGSLYSLAGYAVVMLDELKSRGYRVPADATFLYTLRLRLAHIETLRVPWAGAEAEALFVSHRGELWRRDPGKYPQFETYGRELHQYRFLFHPGR